MFWFSTTYIDGQLVVMDISAERVGGKRTFLAALSENPSINYRANCPDFAVARLTATLQLSQRARPGNITLLPASPARLTVQPAS